MSQPPAIAMDVIADAALAGRIADRALPRCDACDEVIEGEPGGSGLYVWTRGTEVRFEEPPLCVRCATAIGVCAREAWSMEEDEG